MNKLIYKLAIVLIVPLGISLLQGCYPNDSLSATETDVVLTSYNDSVDFKTLKTYYMPDTVFVLGDDDDKKPVDNPEVILDNLASNFAAYGYTRVYDENDETPDVIVTTGVFTSTTVSVGWWYPYYPGYWWKDGSSTDYWYPWYPGYYPPGYWPSYPVYTSYTTGTLIFDMYNPQDYDIVEGDTVSRVYWNGGVQGVLNGGSANTRVKNGIDQAFAQSPQIKTGN